MLLTGPVGAGAPDGGDGGRERAPAEFTALRDVAPSIGQDIRYAGDHNFTGEPVDGYREAECLLTQDAARALRRVQRAVRRRGYALLVYDCYRPQRAVDRFLRWADDTDDTRTKDEFYPRVRKDRLFDEGYLAERSGHSRGSTVDLTLRRDGEPVDMGTGFDFFDPKSHPDADGLSEDQRSARAVLREAMTAQGFVPVETEWWHFTYGAEPFPDTYFDFPVERGVLRD
ncbi:M15 family metallopeptidase [Streptomyces sp. RFCAC02]|uniref:M15 family metallopeptidase n=1 Tax=Streptomyces sp. RFCAC02 TaxID=2499143 RepID=UPI001F0D7BFE|nr:M15 family metallopeptidase [Streptomyces sp. RFCAC02]